MLNQLSHASKDHCIDSCRIPPGLAPARLAATSPCPPRCRHDPLFQNLCCFPWSGMKPKSRRSQGLLLSAAPAPLCGSSAIPHPALSSSQCQHLARPPSAFPFHVCAVGKAQELTAYCLVTHALLYVQHSPILSPHSPLFVCWTASRSTSPHPSVVFFTHPCSHLQKKLGVPLSVSLRFLLLYGNCLYLSLIHSVGSGRPWHFNIFSTWQ